MAGCVSTFDTVTAEIRAGQPYAKEHHVPVFPRDSSTRRVLGFITDDEDALAVLGPGQAPRNTVDAIAAAMFRDEHSPGVSGADYGVARQQVAVELDRLGHAGLVAQRADGTYGLTEAGWCERSN